MNSKFEMAIEDVNVAINGLTESVALLKAARAKLGASTKALDKF